MKQNLNPSPPQWLTLSQLADRWKVCKRTITRIPLDQLPCYNLPAQRRYRLQDVIRYERRRSIHSLTQDANGKGH